MKKITKPKKKVVKAWACKSMFGDNIDAVFALPSNKIHKNDCCNLLIFTDKKSAKEVGKFHHLEIIPVEIHYKTNLK